MKREMQETTVVGDCAYTARITCGEPNANGHTNVIFVLTKVHVCGCEECDGHHPESRLFRSRIILTPSGAYLRANDSFIPSSDQYNPEEAKGG